MANYLCDVALVDGPLEIARKSVGEGAVVEFFGNVRPVENGQPISALEYDAHAPMAEHQLRVIAREAAEKFSLLAVTVHHRIGAVPSGDTSLIVRVASGHRAAAFAASGWIVDELKKRVPIWKTPVFVESAASCHPERSAAKLPVRLGPKDPAEAPLEVSPRRSSAPLGMTR
ncbi:MAG: molybdenum cofactor biosynthesis protein MoaE [Verrucomicrobia bacterium]|nr:molybdenum cofactor biosynthesis protein MoaE [Verrucomicrobiota bacterium]